jgi:hypothetical protein
MERRRLVAMGGGGFSMAPAHWTAARLTLSSSTAPSRWPPRSRVGGWRGAVRRQRRHELLVRAVADRLFRHRQSRAALRRLGSPAGELLSPLQRRRSASASLSSLHRVGELTGGWAAAPAGERAVNMGKLRVHRAAPLAAFGRQKTYRQRQQPTGRVPARPAHQASRSSDRRRGRPALDSAASCAASSTPAPLSRYRCRGGRPRVRLRSHVASSSPRSDSRIRIGYSDPALSPTSCPSS